MNKVNGKKSSFAPVREDGSRITICYGLKKLSKDLYEWLEVYLPKKQTSQLSLQTVKDAIIGDINARTTDHIISGFDYTVKHGGQTGTQVKVWLSQENQFNFKSAYDLAVQKQGATLPVTFKMGEKDDGTPIYHTFETMADAEDFYLQAVGYINQCLAAGWQEKDSIDWTPYENYFNHTS